MDLSRSFRFFSKTPMSSCWSLLFIALLTRSPWGSRRGRRCRRRGSRTSRWSWGARHSRQSCRRTRSTTATTSSCAGHQRTTSRRSCRRRSQLRQHLSRPRSGGRATWAACSRRPPSLTCRGPSLSGGRTKGLFPRILRAKFACEMSTSPRAALNLALSGTHAAAAATNANDGNAERASSQRHPPTGMMAAAKRTSAQAPRAQKQSRRTTHLARWRVGKNSDNRVTDWGTQPMLNPTRNRRNRTWAKTPPGTDSFHTECTNFVFNTL